MSRSASVSLINIPNSLTALRILLIPVFFYIYGHGQKFEAFLVLAFAMLTDYFDGKIARRFKQQTHFGAIFDPVSDRICSIAYYGFLVSHGMIPVWFAVCVLLRNGSQILSIPILVWWLKKVFDVKPKFFAKLATAVSDIFVFIPFFLVQSNVVEAVSWIFYLILAFMELKILITYWPRLFAIALGRHNTFE